MINKLIVAYDGSSQSERAFELALEIAQKHAAQMVVFAVARPPEPPVSVEVEAVLENATEYYRARFKALEEKAANLGLEPPRFEVRVGHPAEQIVHFADEEKADMIVMGHRGESFLQRWLLGSVAKRVLSYAHCSVLVVR